jgi:hypothetical protein
LVNSFESSFEDQENEEEFNSKKESKHTTNNKTGNFKVTEESDDNDLNGKINSFYKNANFEKIRERLNKIHKDLESIKTQFDNFPQLIENTVNFEIEDEITSFTIILNNGAVEGGAQTENLTVNYQEDSTIYYIGNNVLSDTESGSGTTYVDYSFTITNVSEEVFDHIYVWTEAGAITGWPGDAFENNTHEFKIQAEPGVEKFNVILNNHAAGTQTKNMFFAYTKDVVMYYIGQGQLSTDPEAKPQEPSKYKVTFVDASEAFDNIYLWQGGVQFFGAWPGTALVNHRAAIELEPGKYNVIFNGTIGQTGDLEFTFGAAETTVTFDGTNLHVN